MSRLDEGRGVVVLPAGPPGETGGGAMVEPVGVPGTVVPTGDAVTDLLEAAPTVRGHGPRKTAALAAAIVLIAAIVATTVGAGRYRGVARIRAHADVVLAAPLMDKAASQLVDLGTTVVDNVKLGDCFTADDLEAESVVTVDRVACDEPHDEQVVAVFDLAPSSADEDVIVVAAYAGCRDRVRGFVGAPLVETDLGVGFIYPGADQLARGDREVICTVWDGRGGRLGSSVAGSGEDPTFLSFLAMEAGDCFDFNDAYYTGVDRVACSSAHDAEVFAVFDLPATEWPGDRAALDAVWQRCAALFAEASAANPGLGGLTYDFVYPLDFEWSAGEPQACYVVDDTGPLSASVVLR